LREFEGVLFPKSSLMKLKTNEPNNKNNFSTTSKPDIIPNIIVR
jgi:hypothetical protein